MKKHWVTMYVKLTQESHDSIRGKWKSKPLKTGHRVLTIVHYSSNM